MKKNNLFIVTGIFATAFLFCAKEKQETQITPRENVESVTPQESVRPSVEQLTAQLAPQLRDLQNKVMAAPTDIELRKALVACAVDTVWNVVHAVGQGKPPENTTSTAMARQFTERAAVVDGYRWVAYILAWRQHPETPDFGAISGQIPPARLINMDHPAENEAVALVEADLAP
jgi:hypothetical protein